MTTNKCRGIIGCVAFCDCCGEETERKASYLFFSSGMSVLPFPVKIAGVNSEFGLMLLCPTCTDKLMTESRFKSAGEQLVASADRRVQEMGLAAPHDARDDGIIERCVALGLTPESAKEAAKALTLEYTEEPDKKVAAQRAIDFWTRDRNPDQ